MKHIQRIRFAAVLAGLGAALLALTAPAAFARVPVPQPEVGSAASPPPPETHTVTHSVVVGGMPGWQIALIAVGAALLAATAAVIAERARAAHRHAAPAAV